MGIHLGQRDTGAITLAMTLWMLLVFALITLHTASGLRSAVDLMAFDGQGAQAMAAAEAGLSAGLVRLGGRRDGALPAPFSAGGEGEATYSVSFSRTGGQDGRLVRIESRSEAGDGRTVRALERLAVFVVELPRPPATAVRLGGRASSTTKTQIINVYGGRTVLSGLATRGAPAGVTARRFMTRLFERAIGEQRETSRIVPCPRGCRVVATAAGGPALWFRSGRGRSIEIGDLEVGSRAWPRVVVIDGSLAVRRRLHVRGLCVVLGDLRGRGGEVEVSGALVVTGDLGLDRARVVYDPVLLGALRSRGRYRWLAGSWRPLRADQWGGIPRG